MDMLLNQPSFFISKSSKLFDKFVSCSLFLRCYDYELCNFGSFFFFRFLAKSSNNCDVQLHHVYYL